MSTRSLMSHLPGLWAFLKNKNPCSRSKLLGVEIQAPKEGPGSSLKATSLSWKLKPDRWADNASSRVTRECSKRHCFLEGSPAFAELPSLFLPTDKFYVYGNRRFLTLSYILKEPHVLDTTTARGRKHSWGWDLVANNIRAMTRVGEE